MGEISDRTGGQGWDQCNHTVVSCGPGTLKALRSPLGHDALSGYMRPLSPRWAMTLCRDTLQALMSPVGHDALSGYAEGPQVSGGP